MRYLLLITVFFIFSLPSFAQHQHINNNHRLYESKEITELTQGTVLNVKVLDMLFKKVDEQKHVVEFTAIDAIKIEQLLMKKGNVLSCESHALDKTVKVITKRDAHSPINRHRQLVDELGTRGYVVIGLRTSYQPMHFSSLYCKHGTNPNNDISNCTDCGKVQLSAPVLEKYKDQYNTSKIDLNENNESKEMTLEEIEALKEKMKNGSLKKEAEGHQEGGHSHEGHKHSHEGHKHSHEGHKHSHEGHKDNHQHDAPKGTTPKR